MSPNEHYREAERLLADWDGIDDAELAKLGALTSAGIQSVSLADGLALGTVRMMASANVLAAAQVHATLATLGKRDEA